MLTHLTLWVLVLLFFSFFIGLEGADPVAKFIFSAFFLPVTIATTYVFIYNLIPNYLLPKRYFKFSLYAFYAFVVSAVFIIVSAFYGFVIALELEWNDSFPISKSIFYIMITIYLVVVIASAFSLLKNNFSSAAKNEELKNRILEAQLKLKEQELQYLKMQIHPHFLFNSLNTIYGLSLLNDARTPEMILQLSDLLDYILYQTSKPLVSLEDEINHIQNYISLEKKRFGEDLNVKIFTEGIDERTLIPPMLLLPFVENSFKHGRLENGKLEMVLEVILKDEKLDFRIENSVNEHSGKHSAGIGLANIKKRLALLFPGNHKLNIEKTNDRFQVDLQIELNRYHGKD